jgi:hypothetical protein
MMQVFQKRTEKRMSFFLKMPVSSSLQESAHPLLRRQPTRRGFLQASVAAGVSYFVARGLFARANPRSFWLLHTPTGVSWQVDDPVSWSLENARQPILKRAREGLMKLTLDDGDRVIRLVTRRCSLNLLELHPGQVVVHHWGQQQLADLRPFFKAHKLARQEIEVVVRDRKKEIVTRHLGDDYLFGDRLANSNTVELTDFPLDLYLRKWARRFEEQPDDWTPASGTWSGYAWEGVEDNRIPWTALKSAWRCISPTLCLNCDQPTVLTNFGNPWVGMFSRSPKFVHICGGCRRSFKDESVKDVDGWLTMNLDAKVRPDFVMIWDRRVEWVLTDD